MILKWLNKKIKDFKHDQLRLEMDAQQQNRNLGICWVSSDDHHTLGQLVKLHYQVSFFFYPNNFFQVYAGYKLRTYLIGYPYDSVDDGSDSKEMSQFQKKMMKLSL